MARTCTRGGHRATTSRPLPVTTNVPHKHANREPGLRTPASSPPTFSTALELYRLAGDELPWLEPGTVAKCPRLTMLLRNRFADGAALRSVTENTQLIRDASAYCNWHAGEVDTDRIFNIDGSKTPYIIAVVIPDVFSICLEFGTQLREGNSWCANAAVVRIGATVRYCALGGQTVGFNDIDSQTFQRYAQLIRLVVQFCMECVGRKVFSGVALQLFEAVRCHALMEHVVRQVSPLLVDDQLLDDERDPRKGLLSAPWINPGPCMLFDLQTVVNTYQFNTEPCHIARCRAMMGTSVLLVDFSLPHVMPSDSSLYAMIPTGGDTASDALGLAGEDRDVLLGELFS